MANLQTITNNAFRELGITAVGDAPETAEYNEAFALLQDTISSLFGYEMGEPLTDLNVGSSTNLNSSGQALDTASELSSNYIPNNVRLMCNNTVPMTLYLHPRPREGDRISIIDEGNNFATNNLILKGNGRGIGAVGTQSVTLNTNGASTSYFYRGDTGLWTVLDVSVDTLPSPFAPSFDQLLVMLLAKRIAPRYGAQWSDTQEQHITRWMRQFRARYRQETEVDSEPGLYRLPSVIRSRNYFSNTPSNFDKGVI